MAASRKRLPIVLALLAVLLALFFIGRARHEADTRAAQAKRSSSSGGGEEMDAGRRSASPRPSLAKKTEDHDTPAARHFRNFYLRAINFDSSEGMLRLKARGVAHLSEESASISLSQAVEWVKAEYAAIARETKEETLPLTIDISAADTSRALKFRLPRLSVTSGLKLIAAATGNRLEGSGPDFQLVAIPDQNRKESATLELGELDMTKLRNTGDMQMNFAVSDPFAEIAGHTSTEQKGSWVFDLMATLQDAGYELSSGLSFTTDREASTFRGTAADLALLRAALEVVRMDPATAQQTKLTTTILELGPDADPAGFAAGNLDAASYQMMLRQASSQKGTDLISMPSMVARYGQSATVSLSGSADQTGASMEGIQLQITSQPLGLGSEDTYQLKQTFPAAEGGIAAEPLVQISGQAVTPGGNVNVSTTTTPEGRHLLLVHKSERINASGRPVLATDSP
ncbi:MAG: hypothetical protein QM755_22410 [Luteolibacter sp.]